MNKKLLFFNKVRCIKVENESLTKGENNNNTSKTSENRFETYFTLKHLVMRPFK